MNDQLAWVKKYLGSVARKRLILTHHKHLNWGDYLIDDRAQNAALGSSGASGSTSAVRGFRTGRR